MSKINLCIETRLFIILFKSKHFFVFFLLEEMEISNLLKNQAQRHQNSKSLLLILLKYNYSSFHRLDFVILLLKI